MTLRPSLLIAVGALVLFGATATGASGARSALPATVLKVSIGSDLNPPSAGVAFAEAVRRLSHGRLTITFRSVPEGLTADSELLALREVRTGSTEMGWIPTRGVGHPGRQDVHGAASAVPHHRLHAPPEGAHG
jgi:hypothetical protein